MPEASGSIAYLGAARFQGFWNASTNEASGSGLPNVDTYSWSSGVVNELFATGTSPAGGGYAMQGAVAASGNGLTASAGHYWQVTGSGTHNVDGQTNWNLNDWIVYSGSHGTTNGTWKKLAFEDTIASVIMGDLSASDVFHLSGSNDKHVLFVSGTSDHTVNMSGSNNFIIDYNTGSASNRMRVGIGGATGYGSTNVLSPMNVLQVSHTGGDTDDGILIVRSDSSTGDGDLLGGIGFDSTDGNVPSSVTEASAFIAAYAAEDHGTGDKGADLVFGTSKINDDDDTASTEHVRILDSGLVGVGTSNPATLLHVSGTHTQLMVDTAIGIVISSSAQNSGQAILRIKNNSDNGAAIGGHYISGESAQSGKDSFQLTQQTDGAGRLRLYDASGSLGLSFSAGGPGGDGGTMFIMNKGNPADFGMFYFDGSQKPVAGDEYVHISGSHQGLVLSGTSVAFDGLLQGSDVGAGSAAGIRSPLLLSEVSGTNAYFGNNVFVFGDLGVTGSLSLASALVLNDHLSGSTAYFNSNAFVFGDLGVTGSATVAGDITVGDKVIHKDDTDTYIDFGSNSIQLRAGGIDTLAVSVAQVAANVDRDNIDFAHWVTGAVGTWPALFSDAGNGNVGIGTSTPSAKFDVSGSTKLGRNDGVTSTHQITGSVYLTDNSKFVFGENDDAHIEYNEDGDDYLIISGSTTGTVISGSTIKLDADATVTLDAATNIQLYSPAVTIGQASSANPIVYFSGDTNTGYIQWMEDEDRFLIPDDVVINEAEKLNFGTALESHIAYSSTGDDYLTISGSTNGVVISGSNIVIDGMLQGASPLVISGSEASASLIISGTCEVTGALSVSGSTIYNYGDYYNYRPNNTLQFHIDSSNQRVIVHDNQKLTFGSNNDAHIEYDEDQAEYLIISGSTKGIVLSGSNVMVDGILQFTSFADDVVFGNTNNQLSYNSWSASAGSGMSISNGAGAIFLTPSTSTGVIVSGTLDVSGSTVFGRDDGATTTHQFSGSIYVADNKKLVFGQNDDAHIEYDEDQTDYLIISGSVTGLVLSGSNLVFDTTTVPDTEVTVADDSIPFFDADGTLKRESIADFASAIAGTGLTAASGQLALHFAETSAVTPLAATDSVMILDNGTQTKRVTITTFGDYIVGSNGGLANSSGVLAISGSAIADDTVAVADDQIIFLDSDGSVKRETIADLASGMAGTGLGASSGQLTVDFSGPIEIEQSSTGGGTALLVDNNDTDQIAFAIEAANIDADVVDISADAVTTANVIDITADALTSGAALKIVSDSSDTSDRDLVLIHQDHASAVNATPLRIVQDAASCPAVHVQGPTIGGQAATASNNTNGVTITIAMIMTQGVMATGRGTSKTDTTDTAANIVAAIPNVRVGDSIDFLYSNMSSNAVTLAGGTGVVMTNTAAASFSVAAASGRMFRFVVTGISGGSESVMLIPLSDTFSLVS